MKVLPIAGILILFAGIAWTDELETSVAKLKEYEAVSDPENAIKWSDTVSKLARAILAGPKPDDPAKVEHWTATQDYAKQVDNYADYALFNQTVKTKDAGQALMLTETLEKRSPKSPYLTQAANTAFLTLRQSGKNDQAIALAERALTWDPNNEEMLIVAADHYMKKNQSDKVLTYSTRLVEVMNSKPKPDQVSDADWTKRKNTMVGAGSWMAGMTYAAQNKLADADKSLRLALPLLTDEQMRAGALYQLGFVNFKIGEASNSIPKIQEAYRFSQQSAAIKGPYAASAQKNVVAIKTKYRISDAPAAKKK